MMMMMMMMVMMMMMSRDAREVVLIAGRNPGKNSPLWSLTSPFLPTDLHHDGHHDDDEEMMMHDDDV